MQKGNIGVTTDNIFPIIKKFLYSDHEIFLRELVSNAVDATQKLRTLASVGEFKGELGDLKVTVSIDAQKGTLTISDRGIGMTEEDIEKYINQIAFSGAEEFLEKYKNDANSIIGHFGLGFYSSFMVSKKVEIVTLSNKEGASAVRWSCEGSPEYTLESAERSERGTDIILHIDDENKEFLEQNRVEQLLTKYCKFLPVAIVFGKEQEWKDGKNVDTDRDKVINNPTPAWTKKPADLTDEDYSAFYRELYPMSDDPLFHIHLNVDYPFTLTGILYFPKIKSNVDMNRNKIQLFCNQVFVTDSVENIVPEFLTLLHGVIDSPDIPLNVSRSYLQSDANVKKISNHIAKKVSDKLQELFKTDRKQFEEKWDDLKVFIQYGMLSDEKFYERAEQFVLLKNTDNQYYTIEEYKKLIGEAQTDKDGKLCVLYTSNKDTQYAYIDAAKAKGYDVLLLDGQLDVHFAGKLEQKIEKSSFVRVDSDVVDNLIKKDSKKEVLLSEVEKEELSTVFETQLPKMDKTNFNVTLEALGDTAQPVVITQNEFMRRMKEMSAMQTGFSFYGEMPDSYTLVVNTDHPVTKSILEQEKKNCKSSVEVINQEIEGFETELSGLNKKHEAMKADEIPVAESEQKNELEAKVTKAKESKKAIIRQFASETDAVSQLIDIALLANGMLSGQALSQFVNRSIKNMKV